MDYSEDSPEERDELEELKEENHVLRSTLDEYRSMLDKYRTLAECSLAGIYVIQDDCLQYVNPSFMRMMGYEREEDLIGLNFWDMVHEEDRQAMRARNLSAERSSFYPHRYSIRAIRKDGSVAWLDVSNVVARYMDRPADVGTVVDITEQKESEEALLQSEEKYRTIIEQIEDGYYEVDIQGSLTFFNDSFARILGHPPEELHGVSCAEYAAPGESKKIQQTFRQVYTTGEPARAIAWELRRKHGARRHIELSVSLIRDRQGHRIGFRGIARDITERKLVEEELRRHRNHLEDLVSERSAELVKANKRLTIEVADRTRAEEDLMREKQFSDSVIDSQPGLFYLLDHSGRFVRWNANLERLTGYTADEIADSSALRFFILPDRNLVRQRIEQTFSEGRAWCEATVLSKDGRTTPFFLTGVCVDLDGDVYLVGVGVDITERKLAEEALTASERELRVLSTKLISAQERERQRLAMELHDGIGQALTAIKVRVESVLKTTMSGRKSKEVAPLADVIPMIQDTVEDVRRMSRDLRPSMLDTLGILSTIGWMCKQFESLHPQIAVTKDIVLEEADVPEHLKIVIYRVLQEASNNVAKHSGADRLTVHLRLSRGKITLVIQDNGVGFDLDSTLRLGADQRGFGLASMKERTEMSGGEYYLSTAAGAGTTIKVVWSPQSLSTSS